MMESEVQAGLAKLRAECERQLPGIQLVIPVKSTQANFLVSFTYNGQRTYATIHEDDLADWGEANDVPQALILTATKSIQKLLGQ